MPIEVTPPATALEIERSLPASFADIVGNRRLVRYLQDGVRVQGRIPNTLVTGDSRSGKTAAIKLFIRSLFCARRDSATGDPCGDCETCRGAAGTYEHFGLFSALDEGADDREPLHYLPIDCPRITEHQLREELQELRDFDGLRIVYLDEVHRLVDRKLDHMLLKPLEERNFLWIASSAKTTGLEQMFLNRFSARLRTSTPTCEELAEFLAHRCNAWTIDWDEPQTLLRLAERSNQVPGLALQVLGMAAARPNRRLDRELVELHEFLQME